MMIIITIIIVIIIIIIISSSSSTTITISIIIRSLGRKRPAIRGGEGTVDYTGSPSQDFRLFGPRPWKILATTYEKNDF